MSKERKYTELTVGMVLPEKVITDWCSKEGNYYYHSDGWGVDSYGGFKGDRKILEFDTKENVDCFLISKTRGVCARIEGFLDFLNGNTTSLTKENALQK